MLALLVLGLQATADQHYYYHIQYTSSWCVGVETSSGNVKTFTCDYTTAESSNTQLWSPDGTINSLRYGLDNSKCMYAQTGNIGNNRQVALATCGTGNFFFDTTGGATLTLVSWGVCLNPVFDYNNVQLNTVATSSGNCPSFQFVLGPANSLAASLIGIGCFSFPAAFTLTGANATADSCAAAATAGGATYFGVAINNRCVITSTLPTSPQISCGTCALASWQFCGINAGNVGFFYQSPTCSANCVSCSSSVVCVACTSSYHLVGNACVSGPPPTTAPTTNSPTTTAPTASPTKSPTTSTPTNSPTKSPTLSPTTAPTKSPTQSPTNSPTKSPTTRSPTFAPTKSPTTSPTIQPTTLRPTTLQPTAPTTFQPTPAIPTTSHPTSHPTTYPTLYPTSSPTSQPSSQPTTQPIAQPTTAQPTATATSTPTTAAPTMAPTASLGEYGVDFALVASADRWFTFTLTTPPPPSFSIRWDFPSLSIPASQVVLNASIAQLPPFSFAASPPVHHFSVAVINPASGDSAVFSGNFSVVWSPISARILGANRDFPTGTTALLTALVVDTTSLSNVQISYRYLWQLQAPCLGAVVGSASQVNFTFMTATQEQTCLITLTVQDNIGRTPVTVSGVLNTRTRLLFSVDISGDVQTPFATSSTLRLLGTVYPLSSASSASYTFTWQVSPSLPSACLQSTTVTTRALIISPMCLAEAVNYTMIFTATSATQNASAWFSFPTDTRPFGGACTASPSTGVALITGFTVSCDAWTQLGLTSLSYTLKRLIIDTTVPGGVRELALSSQQNLPYFPNLYFSLLSPAALQSELVQLVVHVSADSGEYTTISVPSVTLLVPAGSTCPPYNATDPSVQSLTAWLTALREGITCPAAQRQAAWDLLWQMVQQLSAVPYLDADTVGLISNALQALLEVAPTSSTPASAQLVKIPADFQIKLADVVTTLLNSPDPTVNSTNEVVATLSSALPFLAATTPTSGPACTAVNQLLTALGGSVQRSVAGTLPGERPVQLSQSLTDVSVTSGTYFGDSTGQLNASQGMVSLDLPSTLLSQGGDLARVVVTNYQSSLAGCRAPNTAQQLVGPIVDITLSSGDNGKAVSVSSVQGGFSFVLPLSTEALCGRSQCVWWDAKSSTWSQNGCTSKINAEKTIMTCTCTHLTEFSLLLDPGCVSAVYHVLYLTLLGCYAAIGLLVVVKLIHRLTPHCCRDSSRRPPRMITSLVGQHFLILLLASARIVSCSVLSSSSRVQGLTVATRAALLLLPFLIMFWIYTLLVFQWAAMYHFGMKLKMDAFSKVRIVFVVSNVVLSAALVAVIIVMVRPTTTEGASSTAAAIVEAAAIVIGVVTLITAIAFVIYGRALYNILAFTTKPTNDTFKSRSSLGERSNANEARPIPNPKARNRCTMCDMDLRDKIFRGGLVVSITLCVEAILHIISVASHSSITSLLQGDASEVLTLAAEIVGLCTLMAMYHRAMILERTRKSAKPTDISLRGSPSGINN